MATFSKSPWRIFFLRAAVAAATLRGAWTAVIVLAVGAVSSGLIVVLLLDRIVRACERASSIEDWRDALLGWWGRAFTWPAPPRGWRVATGGAAGVIYYPGALTEQEALRLAARWRDHKRINASLRCLEADERARLSL